MSVRIVSGGRNSSYVFSVSHVVLHDSAEEVNVKVVDSRPCEIVVREAKDCVQPSNESLLLM